MFCHCVDGTPKDDPVCWFYALDNKSRDPDDPNIPADPVFRELRDALTNIVDEDQRTTTGLDNESTRFVDVAMPITAVQMVGSLGEIYGRVCTKKDVYRHALLFGLSELEVDVLMDIFLRLVILFYFRDFEDLVIIDMQWVVDAMATLIREEDVHGSLLQDLLADERRGTKNTSSLHQTSTGVWWDDKDVRRGWFSVPLLDYVWGHRSRFKRLAATGKSLSGLKQLLIHFNLVHEVTRDMEQFFMP